MSGRNAGQLDRRHFFVCNGDTKAWEQSWYTEPFFLSHRVSFDRAASDGPVQPPASIVNSVAGCTADSGDPGLITSTSAMPSVTFAITRSVSTLVPVTTTGPAGIASTSLSLLATTVVTSSISSFSTAATSSVPPLAAGIRDPKSSSSCAGDLDWQAWGAIASLGVGLLVGALVWLLWLLAKSKLPELYNPRRWFVDESVRPTSTGAVISFLLPFLHLPSLSATADRPLTEAQITLHVQLAMLKLATIPTVLGLGVALPLMIAKVPCLSKTTPINERGGRLGSLNDLSLLRLLNALDPSPDSAAGDQAIVQAFTLPLTKSKRALMSTIAPAISSARIRLILLLVLISLISLLSAFFVIFRTYSAFAAYRERFDRDICGGQQMVYMDGREAFVGKSEEGVRKLLKKFGFMKGTGIHAEAREKETTEEREIEVVGVFAIADTLRLAPLIKERANVLDRLEEAETRYIQSFTTSSPHLSGGEKTIESPNAYKRRTQQGAKNASGDPTGSAPEGYVAPITFYQLKDLSDLPTSRLPTPLPIHDDRERSQNSAAVGEQTFAQNVGARVLGSRFVEVNRDSVFYGGKLPIGQRVKITEDGVMVPDNSPPLKDPYTMDQTDGNGERTPLAGEQRVRKSLGLPVAEVSRPASPVASDALLGSSRPVATRHQSTDSYIVVPAATASALRDRQIRPRASLSPLVVSNFYNAISGHRARFKELNHEVLEIQQEMYEAMAEGRGIVGWILVGRGVRHITGAEEIKGRTREDIDWTAIQSARSKLKTSSFWIKTTLVSLVLALLLVPCIGLALSTAPGFAHHIRFLQPIADSDGFGAGVAESVAPTIAISLLTALATVLVYKMAQKTSTVSWSNRMHLALRGILTLSIVVLVIWVMVLAALLFGVDAFDTGTQTARHVADGSIYFTWILFCVLLNLAIILPALTLLQLGRVWRLLRSKRSAETPRQRFRLLFPPAFQYTLSYHASSLALLYGLCLIVIFPLLALPILLLILLAFAASRFMTTNVWCEVSRGPTAATSAMSTIRAMAWGLGLQPALFGLIMLSRREWGIGGAALGFAALVAGLCEAFMASRRPRRDRLTRSEDSLKALVSVMRQQPALNSSSAALSATPGSGDTVTSRSRRVSNVSTILQLIHAILPSVSRLPSGPLPLPSERVDDLVSTERAAHSLPNVVKPHQLPSLAFADPATETTGLLYPPELLAPVPVIWLPDDAAGVGKLEAADLARYHHLSAIVGTGDHSW